MAESLLTAPGSDAESKSHEQMVLSAMLRSMRGIQDANELLSAEDFFFAEHQDVFRAINHIADKSPMVDCIDGGLVVAHLKSGDGSRDWMALLVDLLDADPTGAYLVARAKLVRDASIRRQLVYVSQELVRDCLNPPSSAEDILGRAQATILKIGSDKGSGDAHPIAAVVKETLAEIDMRCRKKTATGVPTGFLDLDFWTGGLQNSELIVLAARPSVGKTALAINILFNAARVGVAGLFISLEQQRTEVVSRILCGETAINSNAIRKGILSPDQAVLLSDTGLRDIAPLPIWINDTPEQRVRHIAGCARRLQSKHKIGLLVIDYLQLITPEDRRMPRQEQVSDMSRSLKLLARELNIPVLCLAQLNRDADESTDGPKLSHLRESGAVEQDADTVVMLWRKCEDAGDIQVVNAAVRKNRNGPTAEFEFSYRKANLRFENYAPMTDAHGEIIK